MKVAITASDAFVAPYIIDALGDAAVVIPDEILEDSMSPVSNTHLTLPTILLV